MAQQLLRIRPLADPGLALSDSLGTIEVFIFVQIDYEPLCFFTISLVSLSLFPSTVPVSPIRILVNLSITFRDVK